jgi:pimeloyl-ACP methyl ester carboxylesterase
MAPTRALPRARALDGDLTVRARGVTWTAVSGAFACETARGRRVEIRGLELHLLEWGPAAPSGVLLLHGGAAHSHWFDAVASALAERHHVAALDQRGHGESAWAHPPAYATEDFAGDIVGVIDRLGWEFAVLVGHSMGGHNAIACAAWHPGRIRGLVIVDSRPAIPAERLAQMKERGERPLRRHPTIEAAVATFRLLPPETSADPALLAHLARESVAWRDGAVSLRFDPACYAARVPVDGWPLLPRITAPALVFRGERSPILPRPMAERLRAELPAARLVEIPGAFHHLVLDRPDVFTRELRGFLDGLGGSGRAVAACASGRPVAP